jgi:hypothetical protein
LPSKKHKKMKPLRILSILALLLIQISLSAQTAYEHISNQIVYNFIDDLATMHIIDANTAIKPYSRQHIAGWLTEAALQRDKLSRQQQTLLDLLFKEYALEAGDMKTGKAVLYRQDDKLSVHLLTPEVVWRDTLFRVVMRPVYGIRYFSTTNSNFYHSYGGAEAISYIGENWSAYASLRDNYQNREVLALPAFLTHEAGGNYKLNEGGRKGGDYSEMRGGLTYSWNWGSVGLVKDHIEWGTNYNGSNIFSGRTPSFAMIKLHMNPAPWIEFNYFHGWLVSQVIDSASSFYIPGPYYRASYYPKYIAANMYTFKPLKNLHLSVGNSIVYDNRNVHPAYMIPFFFFKSLTHTLNRGILNNNSMMFMNISSRQIRHLHLFGSLYVDEFSKTRINDPDRHNFWSVKAGFALTGWPFKDLSLAAEITKTTPMTYQHRVPTTTFETNLFNLGHYLRDNAMDYYISARYNPVSTLQITAAYAYAYKGNLYRYVYGSAVPVDENPVLQDKTWSNSRFSLRAEMLPLPNLRIFAEYAFSDVRGYDVDNRLAQSYLDLFTPAYLHGNTQNLIIGFNMGF